MENIECCSICLEQTDNKLPCNHSHCVSCLKRWIKKSNRCPICRNEFDITKYKYKPPQFSPSLKLSRKTKKFFNKFLLSRYLLVQNKHQKFYSSLMSAYHEYIYVNGKYVNPQLVFKMNKYECLQLYIFFKNKYCIFHHQVKNEMIYALEMYLCAPDITNYINNIYSFIV